jgi:SAM-dependent methyltransferase
VSDVLVKAVGWPALILQSDPLTYDRWAWVRRHLPTFAPGSRVLDAGCGNGGFAMYAAHRGADVVGISDSVGDMEGAQRRAALAGLERVEFVVGDLRRLAEEPPATGPFDCVLCLEVIEHVLDDTTLLTRLRELVAPGGTLLLSTPTDDHPPLFGERAHLSGVEDGRHVRWGSSQARLREVVEAAGFRVVRIDPISGPASRRLTSLGYRGQAKLGRAAWAATLLLRPLRLLDPLLLRSRRAHSHCWGVVAVRG